MTEAAEFDLSRPWGTRFQFVPAPVVRTRGADGESVPVPPSEDAWEWFIEAGKAVLGGPHAWYLFRRRMYARNWRRTHPDAHQAIEERRRNNVERAEKRRAQARARYHATKHLGRLKYKQSYHARQHYLAYQRKYQRAWRARKKLEAARVGH